MFGETSMRKMTGRSTDDAQSVLSNVREITHDFASQRSERQRRRELKKEDFDRLRESGYLLLAVPIEFGGIWSDERTGTRIACEIIKTLAHGDSSVALVAAMHPAVIGSTGWSSIVNAPEPYGPAWDEQRRWAFQTVIDGHFWGTIMSEPGSGGDNTKSSSVAKRERNNVGYLLTGQKHFGSGSGMSSYMVTHAVPDGEVKPDTFVLDMRDLVWDGSSGAKLIAPWDGHGMTATQSHGMEFHNFPATRLAFPGDDRRAILAGMDRPQGALFVAVITGVVEAAVTTARQQLESKRSSMRSYERVEWAKVEMESWLVQQAYEGMLREVEIGRSGARSSLLAKETVAELAESILIRISKVIGGSAYSRHTPYGFWLEDVRALGFLRPPWGLAFERVFEGSWNS
jgi:alkylation response protein AidB-like acyl-CoA dehydrogenase